MTSIRLSPLFPVAIARNNRTSGHGLGPLGIRQQPMALDDSGVLQNSLAVPDVDAVDANKIAVWNGLQLDLRHEKLRRSVVHKIRAAHRGSRSLPQRHRVKPSPAHPYSAIHKSAKRNPQFDWLNSHSQFAVPTGHTAKADSRGGITRQPLSAAVMHPGKDARGFQ
jgi:hypothetical protein